MINTEAAEVDMEVAEVDTEEAVMVFLHLKKYFLMDLLFFKIISFN